jgi:hypothetical protein
LARGSLDGIEPGKTTNDFSDLDYTVSATFCSDLVTADGRANRIDSALLKAFEQRAQLIEAAAQQEKRMEQ